MERVYPWYDIIAGNENIMQGDFIYDCPVIIPSSNMANEMDFDVKIRIYDVVIMSQSCDLANKNVDLALVCPVYALDEFEEKSNFYKSREGKESLRRGNLPGYHLLNKCEIEGFNTDYLVVDFRNVYGVHFDLLENIAKKQAGRIRLLPPYREHLSQAFARFFMRVGLPVDIPPFR